MTVSPFASEVEMASFRADAELGMTSTVAVKYKTGRMTQDEGTGAESAEYATRFESVAKFQTTGVQAANEVEQGGRRVVLDQLRIDLPWNCPQVYQDDEITCLTDLAQPRLVGRTFIVGDKFDKDYQTATRLNVMEKP